MPDRGVEAARLREVHKYYDVQQRATPRSPDTDHRRPSAVNTVATEQALPDTALTAFLQLITLRFDAQRAVVSLMDKDDQYFVAEATKTENLVNPSIYESEGDHSWMGSANPASKGEALCKCTIEAEDVPDRPSFFVVNDLQADSRFSRLPYVQGPPHYRFYAGTPLITRDGYRIGSLFVIDDRVRDSIDDVELDFLGVMAQNVMKYMQLQTESQDQRRHMTMSKGLAALVEGRSRIPSAWLNNSGIDTGTTKSHAEDIDSASSDTGTGRTPSVTGQNSSSGSSGSSSSSSVEEADLYKGIYARSANLLRESLDVDYTVFTDTGEGNRVGANSGNVKVVGYSTTDKSTASDEAHDFDCQMEQDFLKSLCKKYPLGKIWSYHEDGSCEFDDEEPMSLDSRDASPKSAQSSISERAEVESQVLRECFPNARQILYSPLFDGDSRNPDYFSACFAISNHEIPVFTTNIEVAFVRAFVNSVGVVCGHLSAALGDKQKSEFISSMSHELRSPLHGILASTELLYGTQLDSNQKDLCETVDVCGQTLLDTLSQILDYSKLNNFLRSKHSSGDTKTNRPDPKSTSQTASIAGLHAGSSLHVYSECDVAALCEEALDVVNMSFAHLQAANKSNVQSTTLFGAASEEVSHQSHDRVIVEFIAPNYDWTFLCSPGAIRRVAMNLIGNSFKYTSSGLISIKLDLEEPGKVGENSDPQSKQNHILSIRVVDTGRGMSEEFMKTRLFVPFSQESSAAPGSGLGLSLVQGIVKSLDGNIEISSTAGKGTTIEVKLPVKRLPVHITKPHSFEVLRPPSMSNSMISEHQTYTIIGTDVNFSKEVKQSLRYYMQSWLSMEETDMPETANFTFLHETELKSFIADYNALGQTRYTLVLSRAPILPDVRDLKYPNLNLEPLRIPFGPHKLLKALRACVNQPAETSHTEEPLHDHVATPPKVVLSQDENKHPGERLEASSRPSVAMQQRRHQSALLLSATAILPERPAQALRSVSQPETSQTSASSRILCVDDNPINLKLLQTFARKLGFTTVETAEDGLQALTAAEGCAQENDGTGGFDVIFMDLTMPVMDGFESTRRIRALEEERTKNTSGLHGAKSRPRRAVIVALTGLASEEDQRKAFAAGVDHFVTKPLRFKDLKNMLAEWKIEGWSGGEKGE